VEDVVVVVRTAVVESDALVCTADVVVVDAVVCCCGDLASELALVSSASV
jgi:hypothetical protein